MNDSLPLRRLGVIGDVHGEDQRLETALDWLLQQNVDRCLCTGDIIDGPGNVERCCSLLKAYQVATVRGNHERWLFTGTMRDLPSATLNQHLSPEALHFLQTLPITLSFETPAGRVWLCHGLGENDMAGLKPGHHEGILNLHRRFRYQVRQGGYRYVLNGHTHQRMVSTFGELTVINAGSLTSEAEACFALVDFTAGEVEYIGFDGAGQAMELEVCKLSSYGA